MCSCNKSKICSGNFKSGEWHVSGFFRAWLYGQIGTVHMKKPHVVQFKVGSYYPFFISTSCGLKITCASVRRFECYPIAKYKVCERQFCILIVVFNNQAFLARKIGRNIFDIVLAKAFGHAHHNWVFPRTILIRA